MIPLFPIISCSFLRVYLKGTTYLLEKRIDLLIKKELKITNDQILIEIVELKDKKENLT